MNIDLNEWIMFNRRYLDSFTKFCLTESKLNRIPYLELTAEDGESYTDGLKVHIGIDKLNADNENELMALVLFRIGHEVQHCLSTTDKSWMFGINTGYHIICETLSKRLESKPRIFRTEDDYDIFIKDLADKYNIYLSKNTLLRFSHFICNSLEDGRIERLRSKKRPGFADYVVFCRGRDWERTPLDDDMIKNAKDIRTHVAVVMNQVLTLATMGIYQKRFSIISAKSPKTHKLVQSLIPEISKAVYSGTCRKCMEHAIEIIKILADDLAEAATLTDLEVLLSQILKDIITKMSYPANSKNEETGDDISQSTGNENNVSYFDDSIINDNDESSQNESNSDVDRNNAGDEQAQNDKTNEKGENNKNNNDPSNKDRVGKAIGKPSDSTNTACDINAEEESKSIEDRIKEAFENAKENVEYDAKTALDASSVSKKTFPSDPVTVKGNDFIPDGNNITSYPYTVTFNEEYRDYKPNMRMPSDIASKADITKRKIEKIFKNMEIPAMKAQEKGKIDPSRLFKLAMGEMDCFKRKQIAPECEWAAYFLCDNSGSMGNGIYSKRYYACMSLAVIEHAFEEIMPVKITAFDAFGNRNVRHQVVKNWSEKVHYNGSYNFYAQGKSGRGNKDGYSIKIATQELLQRSEKKKLLVVLSDGLPSDYDGNPIGETDVSNAVKEAIKAGIEVFSIYFGGIDSSILAVFNKMYGDTRSVAVEPDMIMNVLIKRMKKFCFRK